MKLSIEPFIGQHCETTATGTLLNQIGIELSEPLLFGLGEGLSFIFWNMKTLDFPFIGGRVKPDILSQNIANNLQLDLQAKETSSKKKAWNTVKEILDAGQPVGLKLDAYHLEYFSKPFHFAGHYVAMYGYDDNTALLVDTAPQGTCVETSLESLTAARSEKGPMSSKNLYYTISKNGKQYDLKHAVVKAARSNAIEYLNPPISNCNFRGIEKTAKEIVKWFDNSKDIKSEFETSAMLMERAGTGGALFRNLYRDFLKESYELTQNKVFQIAYDAFCQIADDWKEVARLFEKIAETEERQYVDEVAALLRTLSLSEKAAMEKLAKI